MVFTVNEICVFDISGDPVSVNLTFSIAGLWFSLIKVAVYTIA